jgi:NAD(P)-dependent dehydrogenase (short-subunit alcohol dehydrogenase family)
MQVGSFDMAGRVALVTGGTAGIGRRIAERLLEVGADVVVCARKAPPALPRSGTREAMFVAADVRDVDQIGAVFDALRARFDRLDLLVNNAGGSPMADAASASPRFSTSIVQLNLLAPLFFAQRANAVMQAQAFGGSIVNIASISGTRPSPGTAAYGAAKAGLLNLTTSLAIEWAPKVRVNAITAGLMATEKAELHYGDAAKQAAVAATVPMQRLGSPDDVASAVLYLASPLAAWVSGAALPVHGGGESPGFLTAAR